MRKISTKECSEGLVLVVDGNVTSAVAPRIPAQLKHDLKTQHGFTEEDMALLKERCARNVVKKLDLSAYEKHVAVEVIAEQL